MIRIFPSLICGNILNLEWEIKNIYKYCDGFHIDVMDNHFVDNLTWGPIFINAIAKISPKILFVHIMAYNSFKLIQSLSLPPESIISFHIENKESPRDLIKLIKEKRCLPSMAISPKTPLEELDPFLSKLHQVLLMSVEPGHSGQLFLDGSIERLNYLTNIRASQILEFRIAMDGGINFENIRTLVENGAQDFCIGSGIFKIGDPIKNLQRLYKLVA